LSAAISHAVARACAAGSAGTTIERTELHFDIKPAWRLRRAGLETSGAGERVGAVPAAHGSHPGNARVIDGPRSVPKCASGTSRQITTEWHAVRMLSHALYRSIKRSF
jgi:hypothetical protein